MKRPPVDEIKEQIERTKGNVSAVARAFDVDRRFIYNWIQDSPTLIQALEDSRERMVDDAESILYKRVVTDQDMQAVMYVLNNMKQAKNRGWGPKQEIAGADGGPLTFRVLFGEDGGDDAND